MAKGKNSNPWANRVLSRDELYESKRQALLQAAAKAFVQQGYERTSVDDVVKPLNITKATVYYYVKNKDNLAFEVKRSALEQVEAAIFKAEVMEATGLEKLVSLCKAYAKILKTDFGICLAMLDDRMQAPETRKALGDIRHQLGDRMDKLIQHGIDDGSIRDLPPHEVVISVFGALNWIAHWYRDNPRHSTESVVNVCLDTFIYGLAAKPPKEIKTVKKTTKKSGRLAKATSSK